MSGGAIWCKGFGVASLPSPARLESIPEVPLPGTGPPGSVEAVAPPTAAAAAAGAPDL